jgi:hypothetical protein
MVVGWDQRCDLVIITPLFVWLTIGLMATRGGAYIIGYMAMIK